MATIQPPSYTSQLNAPHIGLLNAQALPEGLSTVYLNGRLYKITDKKGSEPRIACAISLFNHLKITGATELSQLKEEMRVGVLHVEGGRIKSLTLPKEQIQMMQANKVNEIAFQVKDSVLVIKDSMILREFASKDEYQRYVHHLSL